MSTINQALGLKVVANHAAQIRRIQEMRDEIAQLRRELEQVGEQLQAAYEAHKVERKRADELQEELGKTQAMLHESWQRADLNERAMRLMAHAYSFIPVDECIVDFLKLAQEEIDGKR